MGSKMDMPRMRVEVQVPATTANLGPGFDCLGMALDLYTTVVVERRDKGLVINVEGEGAEAIPRTTSNLVLRAVHLVFDHCGLPNCGLSLCECNRIPLARGLGSSAAAVVAGLLAGSALAGLRLDHASLLALARRLEGHLDNCAAALLGGMVITAGPEDGKSDHEAVPWIRLRCPPGLVVVAASPEFTLATAAARRVLPDYVSLADATFNLSRVALLVAALSTGRMDLLRTAMQDRLHQSYRGRLVPGLERALAAGLDAGAWGTALSGAGSSVVALTDEEHSSRVGDSLQAAFAWEGVKARIFVLRPAEEGARVRIIAGGGIG